MGLHFFHNQKEPGCNKKTNIHYKCEYKQKERFAADQLLLENDYHLFINSPLAHFVLIK